MRAGPGRPPCRAPRRPIRSLLALRRAGAGCRTRARSRLPRTLISGFPVVHGRHGALESQRPHGHPVAWRRLAPSGRRAPTAWRPPASRRRAPASAIPHRASPGPRGAHGPGLPGGEGQGPAVATDRRVACETSEAARALHIFDDSVNLPAAPRGAASLRLGVDALAVLLFHAAPRRAGGHRASCSAIGCVPARAGGVVLEAAGSASILARCSASWASRSRCGGPCRITGGQAEARGDLERQRPAGGAVDEAVGRLEAFGVNPKAAHTTPGCRGVALQRVVVRRRQHRRAALPEVLDDGHRQGPALERVRARPTSSSSTSAGSSSARSMAAMLVMCQEKVLRLAAIDCSSPMSAKTVRNTGSGRPGRRHVEPRPGPSAPAGRRSSARPSCRRCWAR